MQILFVTQYFYPENFRINDLAKTLVSKGHDVSVLTGLPNYPKGKLFEGYTSNGPFYEEIDGIKVYRVKNRPRKTGSLNLALNYLSFVVKGCAGAKKMAKNEKFDVIYAFGTSPITQALPAIVIRKRNNTPIILNVQDLWPDNVAVITGIDNKFFIKAIDLLVDYIYNRCDIILGTSKSFVEAIKSRRGLRIKHKVKYWPQYATVKKASDVDTRFYDKTKFNIAFTGNIGQGQGLEKIIEALAKCQDDRIVLNLFGDGRAKEELSALVKKLRIEEAVRFHGSFPEKEIPGILNGADVALLSLNDSPIFEKTIPAKLQTYLCCGCAILGVASGEAKRLIEDNNIGICAKDSSIDSIAMAISKMADLSEEKICLMKQNSLKLSEDEFDKETLVNELIKMMEVLGKK